MTLLTRLADSAARAGQEGWTSLQLVWLSVKIGYLEARIAGYEEREKRERQSAENE
jgi:hypothetical protein